MSVLRRFNALSQERVDVSDILSIESAVSNDFDQLIQSLTIVPGNAYVVRGFNISMANSIGNAASSLNLIVDPGALLAANASQSGTFFLVEAGTSPQQLNFATNTRVNGAFSPSSTNYVGIDYERMADDSTSAPSYFWDPASSSELIKNVPKAITMDFTINISSSIPPTNILPIAIVVTDSGNNVLSIEDCRPMMFSLGQGGFTPNPGYTYPWPEGQVAGPTVSTSSAIDPFSGGDKSIGSQKDFDDAVATQILGIIGGPFWFSPNTSGSLSSLRQDLGNTLITGKGFIAHSATTPGQINWDQNIFIKVIGSSLSYELTANPSSTDITLTEDEVAYITLVRGVLISPNLIFTNGSPIVTSVGAVAWTTSLQSGDFIKLGTDDDSGYYEILTVNSLTQVTLVSNFTGSSTGASGTQAKYAFGSYSASPTPSTNRNIYIADRASVPLGQDVFWLFLRTDNGGTIPRVYIRFLSSELSQGESEDISDPISLEMLAYIGSPNEAASKPQYTLALNSAALPEINTIQVGAESTIAQNAYFTMFSSGNVREYYVWFNENGLGTDPTPAGIPNSVEVAITTGQTAAQVATALMTQLNLTPKEDFSAIIVSGHTDTVQVTNSSAGAAIAPANASTTFTITQTQAGVGAGTTIIQDGDNLTLAIAKLDQEIGTLESMLDDPSYDETIDVVASGAVPPSSLNGPVAAMTTISLPLNSRQGNAVQNYTVGKGTLQFDLNGQRWNLGRDWLEVGVSGSPSNQIQILVPLEVLDALHCEILVNGGIGTGGGEPGPEGEPGPVGPPGANAAGGPVAFSTKNANYSVLNTDCFLSADCTSGSVTFTLPPASSNGGRIFYFDKADASGNPAIVAASGSDLINGAATITLSFQYQSRSLISMGSSWRIF